MKRKQRKSLLIYPDDLEKGVWIAVHSIKGTKMPHPTMGRAVNVLAVNLPFVVVKPIDYAGTVTLDTRYMNFMKVTDEFVSSQAGTSTKKKETHEWPEPSGEMEF